MATMGDSALFVNTNVLVYANVVETPFHERALTAINAAHEAGRTIWVNWQVIREYLVTMTRTQTFENLPRATMLEQVDQFIERFQIADDTAAVTERLVELIGDFKIGGKQIHDANIVATMQVYAIPCLLTHNGEDFERFGEIIGIERIDF